MSFLAAAQALLTSFDPTQASSGAISATVGALVGVIGTATVAYQTQKFQVRQAAASAAARVEEAAAAALERAIENLIQSLVDVTAAAGEWRRLLNLWSGNPTSYPKGQPQFGGVSMALELVKLRTASTEREATDRLSTAWDRIVIGAIGDAGVQPNAYGLFARAVVAWRAGEGLPAIDNALRQAVTIAESGLATDPR
jgi:hypothetical protein